jgi:GNAT superfamily N-acetyltransferase
MDIKRKKVMARGIKLYVEANGRVVARAFLYILKNDLHERPLGYMEDVFVDEACRGQGLGSKLVLELIKAAKDNNCYKLIGTSRLGRENVHRLYERLGLKIRGKEFRIDF